MALIVLLGAIAACGETEEQQAQATAAPTQAVDPAVAAGFQEVNQTQKVGALEIIVQSAGVQMEPDQSGTWRLLLQLKLMNTAASNDYAYDLSKSLTLRPDGQTPEATGALAPALTAGTLKPRKDTTGYVTFLMQPGAAASSLHFKATGSSAEGAIPLGFALDEGGALTVTRSEPTPKPAAAPAPAAPPAAAPVAAPAAPPAAPSLSSTASLQPGAQIKVGGVIITLNAIVDPYVSSKQFLRPKAGERHVAIDVTLTNDSDRPYDYNTLFDWKPQATDAFTYSASVGSYPDPFLGTGKLVAKGDQARGYVGFAVKEGSVMKSFIFKSVTSTNQGKFETP